MALINIEREAIFIHIYKTGGTSLRNAIGGFECCDLHAPAWQVKSYLERQAETHNTKSDWNDFFKCAIVRNPYDFVASLYHHLHNDPKHIFHDAASGTIDDFVANLRTKYFQRTPFTGYEFFDTQTNWVTVDGEFALDFLLRFETLDLDYKTIQKVLGVDVGLPRLNVNNKRARAGADLLFNMNSIYDINAMYRPDFELFGYERQWNNS